MLRIESWEPRKSERTDVGVVVHTDAGCRGKVGLVSQITVTAERSDGVDALTVLTEVWHHLTLVDV